MLAEIFCAKPMKRARESSSCDSSVVATIVDKSRFELSELLNRDDGYKDIFRCLMASDVENFINNYFEQQPCHVVRSQRSVSEVADVFSREQLLSILDATTIAYSTNMVLCRYKDGQRVTLPAPSPYAEASVVGSFLDSGWTVQFYLPQRFSEGLYKINAGFEHTFGVLAGASAYLTPRGTQGLAPHYDDVEVFILQTEGTKLWRVWEQSDRFQRLPDACSFDIPREDLPPRYSEILLREGDVLYLPRGTIHEAEATSEFSTHATISIYQQNTFKTLLMNILPAVIDQMFKEKIELRQGLPAHLNESFGTFVAHSAALGGSSDAIISRGERPKANDSVEAALRTRDNVINKLIEIVNCIPGYLSRGAVDGAVDKMQSYTTQHRLPPPDLIVYNSESDLRKVKAATTVKLIDPRSFFYFLSESEEISPSGSETKVISLCHCKYNDRIKHMDHPKPNVIKPAVGSEDSVPTEYSHEISPLELARDVISENGEIDIDLSINSSEESAEAALSVDLELPIDASPVLLALIADYRRGGDGVTANFVRASCPQLSIHQIVDFCSKLQAKEFLVPVKR